MWLILKENSEDIREKIKIVGISVCKCAEFKDSIWLAAYPSMPYPFTVHGLGYEVPFGCSKSPEERIQIILKLAKEQGREPIYAEDVDDFIKMILKL